MAAKPSPPSPTTLKAGPPHHDGQTPVEYIPGDRVDEAPQQGVALCLSGGGYRAMLFHLGALWRLNELGVLPTLDRVSSVSGGSITAGVVANNWGKLAFNQANVAANFGSEVVDPIRGLASRTIDVPAILLGFLPWTSASSQIAAAYRRHLYGSATLQALPDRPTFVINSTSLQSGVLWRFTKQYTWDYRVGKIEHPRLLLARAIAASSAFPPFGRRDGGNRTTLQQSNSKVDAC
ncbi:MAG TPA: patatin-like phospholipase family protein [bacterium]|nr:patatin-like phospholipase family protein [bacterium]